MLWMKGEATSLLWLWLLKLKLPLLLGAVALLVSSPHEKTAEAPKPGELP
jgi:hypothetical protein